MLFCDRKEWAKKVNGYASDEETAAEKARLVLWIELITNRLDVFQWSGLLVLSCIYGPSKLL